MTPALTGRLIVVANSEARRTGLNIVKIRVAIVEPFS
jgi:HD-like signal output (HDOD) protein